MPALHTETLRGFIVHVSQVMEAGRPVVYLYGRGEDERTFLIRDTRFVPYFYVLAAEAHRVSEVGFGPAPGSKDWGVRIVPSDRRALHGGPVVRVETKQPNDLRALRDSLMKSGVVCYEADLRPASRYLIDRDLKGALTVSGHTRAPQAPFVANRVFDNPDMAPAVFTPRLSVLSFDIETSGSAESNDSGGGGDPSDDTNGDTGDDTRNDNHILSIAMHGAGADEVLFFSPGGVTPPGARSFISERSLIFAFVESVRTRDPDVLTGWNLIDFDLAVLLRRARALGVHLGLGRDGSQPYIAATRSFWNASSATVTGRVVLDGIQLLRGAFVQMEEYGLDYVAKRVLGEGNGKTIAPASGLSRLEEIQRLYREEPARFVAYNLNDARLVTLIVDKLKLIDLAIRRSLLTGMPLDRVAGSIASFDALYLPELNRRGVVAPSVRGEASNEPQHGGLVLEPAPGLYRNVMVFDFKSLYPSLIRTFQIDPMGHLRAGEDGPMDCIVAPNGARFRRDPCILPEILDRLFPQREAAKRAGDAIGSHAIKILMNSLYGVLGSPSCRFYDGDVANAITGFGREILLWTKARIEAGGRRVLYGDTDSLFVLAGEDDQAPNVAEAAARALCATLNDDLTAHIRKTWGVESRLELEFDTLYLRLLLPKMRQSEGGARKRYVGLASAGSEDKKAEVIFTGMEVVRRDWTELAKQVQRELYDRLFSDRPVDDYLRGIVSRLRAGELDSLLVYKKALRKSLASYVASTPPHVAAARKMKLPAGRLIAYVVTTSGPEPAAERTHPIDRAHYIEKQLRPVAEPVLELLGLDFDAVADSERQLKLFVC